MSAKIRSSGPTVLPGGAVSKFRMAVLFTAAIGVALLAPGQAAAGCDAHDDDGNCVVPTPTTLVSGDGGTSPTTQPHNGGGAGGGGGGTVPQVTAPRTTVVDEDGDGFTVTIDRTGNVVGGLDVDDHSAGLGEVGLTRLLSDMAARGLDPTTLTDLQRLVALTVDPSDFDEYLGDVYALPTTTSTTTAPATSITTAELTTSTTSASPKITKTAAAESR